MFLDNLKKVHIVGIKGSGLSTLAKAFIARGIEVSGSDLELGGHKAENVPPHIDALIYTVAAHNSNPEMEVARKKNIPTYSYPEMLGAISRELVTIAVAGTHGKTTTANMIGKILFDAELDPLVISGS